MGKIVGHDIGNSALKEVTGAGLQRLVPMVVKFLTEAERNTGMISNVKNVEDQLKVKITSSALSESYSNKTLIVGKGATGGREIPQRTQKHKSELPIIVSLSSLAVQAWEESDKKTKNIVAHYSVAYGIPIDYLTVSVKKEFENKIVGTHVVEILTPGFECIVTVVIDEAKVLPEDAVFIFDQTLDFNGKQVGSELENKNVLIVGVGHLTTDVGFISKTNFDPEKSFGQQFGVANSKDRFIIYINEKLKEKNHVYRVQNRAELDQIIANDMIISELGISLKEDWDLKVREDMYNLADWVLNQISVRNIIAHEYFLIGGGTHFYKHYFLNVFSEYGMTFKIPEDPTFATARGLFKWAMSDRGLSKAVIKSSEKEIASAKEE
jgi:hypothetical protein